jgi:hypothetical protein
VRVWVEDLKFHFAHALRAAGIGLAAVAWASALSSEAQQNVDVRTAVQVASAIVGVCISQWFTGLPPSATLVDLLQPFERDILAVAREQARGDAQRMEFLIARIATLAAVRIRRGANVPVRDRRAWLRALGRLAVLRQAQDERPG